MKKSKTTSDTIDERPLLTPRIKRLFSSYESISQHSTSNGNENQKKCDADDNGRDEARDQNHTPDITQPSIVLNYSIPDSTYFSTFMALTSRRLSRNGGETNNVAEVIPDLALYEDEYNYRPKVAQIIRSMSVYSPLQPGAAEKASAQKSQQPATMGTFIGVFLPCVQNIFGVLFFIRLGWIVGTAGLVSSFFIVLICCLVTFTTSISLSAIATNGMVPAGGPYYMISRNLGPELGGAVGILFYLGTTVAASMYITGAAEIFLLYLVPEAKIFDEMTHCYRLYGTVVLFMTALIVIAGVKVVNKFALPTVVIVNLCIVLSFVGMFVNINGTDRLKYCMVGDRLADLNSWLDVNRSDRLECTPQQLRRMFCKGKSDSTCDPYFLAMNASGRIGPKQAILGMTSGVIKDNLFPKYMEAEHFLTKNTSSDDSAKKHDPEDKTSTDRYVQADIATSFVILVGVFFPSVTGIMAGSNRSGNLRDASRSIPLGTIAATTMTSIVYLLGTVMIAASVDEMFIRDKFGQSAFSALVVAELAVPHPMVVYVGSLIATTGAGMQSLTGAPRLLQAIASDGVIPLLAPLQKTTKRGEPLLAILLTVFICELGILIAALESITALISQFFLMCYLGVNSACALQSLLKAPSWRPRFRYYHWSLSMFGSCLCVAVMFMSNWIFAILAIIIGVAVYKYIEYRGAEKEWGDGIRGLGLSAARYALLNLEEGPLHTKNWRPQLLILCKLSDDLKRVKHEKMLSFASQLKAGKGLTVIASVIQGKYISLECSESGLMAKETLANARKKYKIKGFCEVLVSQAVDQGMNALIQTSGLGGLKHNTVFLNWPTGWKTADTFTKCQAFVDTLRATTAAKCAAIVPKNIDNFPDISDKMTGRLDVWWVVHDGGMLLLLPFLLRQNRTWRNTKLRVFTVAQPSDNSRKIKEDLGKFVYNLRIEAEVDVVEMENTRISESTYERTWRISQRSRLATTLSTITDDSAATGKHSDEEALLIGDTPKTPDPTKLSYIDMPDETISTPSSIMVHQSLTVTPITPETMNQRRLPPPPSPTLIEEAAEAEQQCAAAVINPTTASPLTKKGSTATPPRRKSSFAAGTPDPSEFIKSNGYNLRRMHTAVRLNELIRARSGDASLVFVNLPAPPKTGSEEYYMEFLEALTEGLDKVLLVKGTGTEVVTIYS